MPKNVDMKTFLKTMGPEQKELFKRMAALSTAKGPEKNKKFLDLVGYLKQLKGGSNASNIQSPI